MDLEGGFGPITQGERAILEALREARRARYADYYVRNNESDFSNGDREPNELHEEEF